jgi:hypothetical protein
MYLRIDRKKNVKFRNNNNKNSNINNIRNINNNNLDLLIQSQKKLQ